MEVESLLKARKITPEQFDCYMLCWSNEQDRERFNRMKQAYLMEEPQEMDFNETGFTYYAGRRSVIMDICRAILMVEEAFKKEINND